VPAPSGDGGAEPDHARHPGRHYDEFVKGLWRENPVFVQVLGMCPMLAVTNSAINALAMGRRRTFVLLMLEHCWCRCCAELIPKQVRISTATS
jgi:electron transport complex protein RnfE